MIIGDSSSLYVRCGVIVIVYLRFTRCTRKARSSLYVRCGVIVIVYLRFTRCTRKARSKGSYVTTATL